MNSSGQLNLDAIVTGLYSGIVLGLLAGVGEQLNGSDNSILTGIYVGVTALATRTGLEPALRSMNDRRKTRLESSDQ